MRLGVGLLKREEKKRYEEDECSSFSVLLNLRRRVRGAEREL